MLRCQTSKTTFVCCGLQKLLSEKYSRLYSDGRTYTVQVLCTCIPLPTRISTMLPSTGSEHGITASSAVSHIIRPDGACYTKVITLGDCAFAVAWNNLPDAIRHSPSLETFKRSLKSHLFLQCFCSVLVSLYI